MVKKLFSTEAMELKKLIYFFFHLLITIDIFRKNPFVAQTLIVKGGIGQILKIGVLGTLFYSNRSISETVGRERVKVDIF